MRVWMSMRKKRKSPNSVMSSARLPTGHAIRDCIADDFEDIYRVVNEAAQAYRGVIPDDCWHEPYMDRDELRQEIDAGVRFQGYRVAAALAGVMGMQAVRDVTLIRHAYVHPAHQRQGIGGTLLTTILETAPRPVLVGTWAAARWAINFYQRHGFVLVDQEATLALLSRYWKINQRQAETSVVLRLDA